MRKTRVPATVPTERRQICRASTVDEMLASTPPSEIGDGHLISSMERAAHRARRARGSNFGSVLPARSTRNDAGRVARPPDKRTRVEPETARIPSREGGPVLL